MIPSMLEIALRGLLVAAAVWAGLRLLGVRDVRAQKSAWVLVLAAAVLMPLLLPLAVRWQFLNARMTLALPVPWSSAAANPAPFAASQAPSSTSSLDAIPASAIHYDSAPAAQSSSTIPASAASASLASGPTSTIQTPPPPSAQRFNAPERRSLLPTLQALALAIYFAVCGVLILRLIYGLTSAISLWLDAEPVDVPHLWGLRVRASRAISSPVTVGSGVVLPSGYDEWGAEKLRIVLAHERSHIRQGDFYLQLVAGFYSALFWFSPLGWWLRHKLSDLGEALGDRAALREAESRPAYAQILLEFAGMPRPTLIGVAMARASSLSHRIERLLNDSSFRQAFSSSRSRALAAVLLVPAALFASTALLRVQAATGQDAAASQPSSAPASGVSHPDASQDVGCPGSVCSDPGSQTAPASPAAPAAPPATGVTQLPPGASAAPAPPEPPEPPSPGDDDNVTVGGGQTLTITSTGHGRSYAQSGTGENYAYSFNSEGESYALVMGPDNKHLNFSGNWSGDMRGQIEKARRAAHGPFLWFLHDGKSYVVDDPAIVNQIAAMYKPMEELGRQQEALGKQQEELGRQQEALGRKQEEASVPTPDVSKEIAALNEAIARLRAKQGGTITQEELADIQGKIGDIQGRLGDLQGKIGDIQGRLGEEQGKLGTQQGELGAQQGRLGAEQGRIAHEADRKVKSIIDQSLQNGKARPVE